MKAIGYTDVISMVIKDNNQPVVSVTNIDPETDTSLNQIRQRIRLKEKETLPE